METLCRYATDAKHRGTTHAKRRDRGRPATLDDQKHERDRQQQTDRSPLVQATANPVAATTPHPTTALTTQALSSASSSPTTSLSATNIAAQNTALAATTTQGGAQLYALAPRPPRAQPRQR